MSHIQSVMSVIGSNPVTPALTSVAINDVVVLVGYTGNGAAVTLPVASGGSFTFTLRQSRAIGTEAGLFVWTGVAGAAASAVTFTNGDGNPQTAVAAQQHRGIASIGGLVGGTSTAILSTTTPSGSLTTTSASSDIAAFAVDYNALDPGATRTYQTVNGTAGVERGYVRDGAAMTAYSGHHPAAGATGAKTVGLTLPNSGGRFTVAGVELVPSPAATPSFDPASFADTAFYTSDGAAAQTVSPTGITSAQALGSPTVTPGAVTVSPTGVGSAETVGSPTLTVVPPAQSVNPTGVASAEAVGAPTVTPGAVTLSPTGIASAGTVGPPTVTPGPVTVSPAGVASTGAVGTPTLTPGPVTVSPTGVAGAESVGAPTVSVAAPGALTVSPTGIASGELIGTPTLTPGPVTVSPAGVSSAEAVGSPTVTVAPVGATQTVFPVGIGAATAPSTPPAFVLTRGRLALRIGGGLYS